MGGIAGLYYYNADNIKHPITSRFYRERPVQDSENFVSEELILQICQQLKNRGPDDYGIYISQNKNLGLLNTRLAIVDTKKIPLPISSESSDIWLIFDGEIFNHKDLRKYLSSRGHTFKSNTDSEVIIHLYEEFQEMMLESLRGMFAFAVWDEQDETLMICRDRIGIKPLYYYKDSEKFAFASELPALFSFSIKKELNLSALKLYLILGYIPSPLTIFKNIYKLQPGHLIKFENKQMLVKKYWEQQFPLGNKDKKIDYVELISDIFSRLRESVEMNISEEADTGILLSGGINSAIITGLSRLSSQKKIKTFSLSGQ